MQPPKWFCRIMEVVGLLYLVALAIYFWVH